MGQGAPEDILTFIPPSLACCSVDIKFVLHLEQQTTATWKVPRGSDQAAMQVSARQRDTTAESVSNSKACKECPVGEIADGVNCFFQNIGGIKCRPYRLCKFEGLSHDFGLVQHGANA